MWRFDLDDDKIFLETDLSYAEYEIGFVMVGADGKPMKKTPERPHCRPRGCEISLHSYEERWCPRALAQDRMEEKTPSHRSSLG